MRHGLWLILLISLPWGLQGQGDDPAAKICLALLSVNMRDTNNIYSDQYHFSQVQNILKTANFSSYQDYSSQGAGLGIDIPLTDGLIGFKGDYKSNSGSFKQQMATFLSSTFDENMQHNVFAQSVSKLNDTLLHVANSCQANYFNALRDRIKLSVDVQPNDYSSFLVRIAGYVPQTLNTQFQISQIEPNPPVTCTKDGVPVQLPLTLPSGQVLLTCTKPENKQLQFAISSNLGNSDAVLMPAKPAPNNTVIPRQTTINATWSEARPATGNPLPYQCPCVSSVSNDQGQTVKMINNCNGQVPMLGVKDTDPNGRMTSPDYPFPGRSFAYLVLDSQKTAIFDMSGATVSTIVVFACPGLAARPQPLTCQVDPSALPAGTPRTICPPPNGSKKGDSCTCPKYTTDASGHLTPAGTYPGKVVP